MIVFLFADTIATAAVLHLANSILEEQVDVSFTYFSPWGKSTLDDYRSARSAIGRELCSALVSIIERAASESTIRGKQISVGRHIDCM